MAEMSVSVRIPVTEDAVYRYAGVTGDFSRMHVDAEYARHGAAGRRIAHGVMLIVFGERARALWAEHAGVTRPTTGYDRIRFIKPVPFGSDLTVEYTGDPDCPEAPRQLAIRNEEGEMVCVATHLVGAA